MRKRELISLVRQHLSRTPPFESLRACTPPRRLPLAKTGEVSPHLAIAKASSDANPRIERFRLHSIDPKHKLWEGTEERPPSSSVRFDSTAELAANQPACRFTTSDGSDWSPFVRLSLSLTTSFSLLYELETNIATVSVGPSKSIDSMQPKGQVTAYRVTRQAPKNTPGPRAGRV